ncbi:16S rRNA (uracil(1498)-N(3))-methyltransferase [Acinetobacter rudis]|uniref:Ribosomal RNA small subunit methyltransferase E n=1 Tax=Acinetobacter rudis TaxID=632955 RepID=A0AAW8J3H4_9GAMM|nr:16S rRNA (uracil(1498)-N(3))-methyltransferase [Acinetobacter rudis]MDQ8934223.1 16S rRNA (uracil(1498)-N(3))-methyltransferase [Acinetobacter rudis]MDQ8952620.1 16S rRNA (uracil(1498)-N(3))-methyltransferase [Acinetobacter rudis]MDQ9016469.1 16S rRNA (uracil(1498)-N(3))-methyltransferase [Acinetobacter rudis]
MNIVLLSEEQCQADIWFTENPRQLQHIHQHLALNVGDTLKVGIRSKLRYLTQVTQLTEQRIELRPISSQAPAAKLPITLIVAMPRPKVLRRLIMDSVSLGVEKIVLIHSYRVDKSYWQSPFLRQIDDYVTLGLEQAGDTIAPNIEIFKRFKPFVEDILPTYLSPERPAFVAHPYAEKTMPFACDHGCTVIIGPEGGFIPYEIELLEKNGVQAVSLGSRILRTETAISYILGRLMSRF